MFSRRNDLTHHYEIIIDEEEIAEALLTPRGWQDFIKNLAQLYSEIKRSDKT